MRTLDRTLLRELRDHPTEFGTIALVMACGIATFVMAFSVLDSLEHTRDAFYEDHRFADVFAALARAPEPVADRLRTLPGVQDVETRVAAPVTIDVEGFDEPVRGAALSQPDRLNRLHLVRGRLLAGGRDREVVLSETFAEAHGLSPGDRLGVLLNGKQWTLTIVGTALSPEYIYEVGPGAVFPDNERFGVLWMERSALGTAAEMQGAFNDVAVTLAPGGRAADVIERLDAVLARYGGVGAYGRMHQRSNRFLTQELRQLAGMASVLSSTFLLVAAFLLHVAVGRLVNRQREQIALLKALGYGNAEVGWHYLRLVLVVTVVGVGVGTAAGVWLSEGLGARYLRFYRFPELTLLVRPGTALTAIAVSGAAALLGAFTAVRRAVRLVPAEAMRPAAPARYRPSPFERSRLRHRLSQPTRMILRHLQRRWGRALTTVAGLSLAFAIVVLGAFLRDAIDYVVGVQYHLAAREDANVIFTEATNEHALHSLTALPGIMHGEGYRFASVQLRNGHRTYRTSLLGLARDATLYRVLDLNHRPVAPPAGGVLLSEYLGEHLGVVAGDTVVIELFEGARPTYAVPVAGFVRQYVGQGAYMERTGMNRLLGESPVVTGAMLSIERTARASVYTSLKDTPRVAGVVIRKSAIENFYATVGAQVLTLSLFVTLLATGLAFGVVYNTARVTLLERRRELAGLRVLGFSRSEAAYLLLGELAILTAAALPVGVLVGWGLSAFMVSQISTDLIQLPLVVTARTYALAATVVLAASALSAAVVSRRLAHEDLVAVLKTREG